MQPIRTKATIGNYGAPRGSQDFTGTDSAYSRNDGRRLNDDADPVIQRIFII